MKHLCGYHNPEKMGAEWGANRDPNDERFTFLTNRAAGEPDDVLWVVTSEKGAKPKIYYLCAWFVVTSVSESGDSAFKFKIEGVPGYRLGPWLSLNPKEWFPGFRERQRNFGPGVNVLEKQDIYCLIDIVQREGKPVPKP
jgi:hypothetical protein